MEIATSTPIAKVSDNFKKNLIINLTLTFKSSSISGSQHCESWYLSKFFPGNQLVDLGDLTSIFSTFPFLIPFFFFPVLQRNLSMIIRKLRLIPRRFFGIGFTSPSASATVWTACFAASFSLYFAPPPKKEVSCRTSSWFFSPRFAFWYHIIFWASS